MANLEWKLCRESRILAANARFGESIGSMDALSEVLRLIKLEGAIYFNGEFSAPWCVRANQDSSNGTHYILYHLLTEGRAYAHLQDGPRMELTAGDIIVFPHADAHLIGNGLPVKPIDSTQAFAEHLKHGLKLARFGGGGEITRFVCGYLACESRLSDILLAGLPPVFVVNITKEPSGQWLHQSIRFSVDQAANLGASGNVVVAKLSEVLFVETLRRYIQELPEERIGWLAGARDPVVGRALSLLHKRAADPWTIASLAKEVGLSRTRLAERFRHFLGEPPMSYLTRWRLKLAADMLQSTDRNVGDVAAEVGYNSETAFNRAFRREFAQPPAQFRRGH